MTSAVAMVPLPVRSMLLLLVFAVESTVAPGAVHSRRHNGRVRRPVIDTGRCREQLATDSTLCWDPVEHVRVQVGGVTLHEAEERGPAGALPRHPEEPQAGHAQA